MFALIRPIFNSIAINRLFSTTTRRLITKGTVSPKSSYPKEMLVPPYVRTGVDEPSQNSISVLKPEEIECMRLAGSIAKKVSLFAGSLVKPGVTLDYIDKTTHEYCMSLGYYPSCLGKNDFPKSISISVNEVVCHGIPDDTVLVDGDIVKVDLVMYAKGYHGDTCRTFMCGNVDDRGKQLIDCTKRCLDNAISICKIGVEYSEIGRVIEETCKRDGFDVVRDYCGHGIGRQMHMLPFILHFKNRYGGKMVKNQVFTIEPMIVEGSGETRVWKDGWTVVTKDNSRCAQYEHTIIVTEHGAEILT